MKAKIAAVAQHTSSHFHTLPHISTHFLTPPHFLTFPHTFSHLHTHSHISFSYLPSLQEFAVDTTLVGEFDRMLRMEIESVEDIHHSKLWPEFMQV
jgi:hypothetical protein